MIYKIISDFITAEENQELLQWALRQQSGGLLIANNAGPFRFRNKISNLERLELIGILKTRICESYKIDYVEESKQGTILSIISDGGVVHKHNDPIPPKLGAHFRCNLFIQTSDRGGSPIIQLTKFKVTNNDLVCFYPDRSTHSTDFISGRDRIMISFGIETPHVDLLDE